MQQDTSEIKLLTHMLRRLYGKRRPEGHERLRRWCLVATLKVVIFVAASSYQARAWDFFRFRVRSEDSHSWRISTEVNRRKFNPNRILKLDGSLLGINADTEAVTLRAYECRGRTKESVARVSSCTGNGLRFPHLEESFNHAMRNVSRESSRHGGYQL